MKQIHSLFCLVMLAMTSVWASAAEKTVTFINDANWETVYVYAWDKDNKPVTDEWPGTTLTEKDVEGNYIWTTKADPVGILFNNGFAQTTDLDFKDGGVYNSTGRVIVMNDYSATFKTDGMDEVWAYVWNGDVKALGDWPGTKMEGSNGEFSIAIKAEEAPKFIIFHNNKGKQTDDLAFENGKAYSYKWAPETTTATFNFADPNFRANIGENMADTKGFFYNEIFTAEDVSLQVTSGSAPSRIYVDDERGQCLVTYKAYPTLTFRAPTDYVITKIEFTAAGNSNIKDFTASSGNIEDMTWTGNANGVRFRQGGTSYLSNAIVTLAPAGETFDVLPDIKYTECDNIAAFKALKNGTYAKVHLNDVEIIGKSADGYSTVWIQDATGGACIQYTSLNVFLKEGKKFIGSIDVIKRVASGNLQMKEAEDTPYGSFMMGPLGSYTVNEGKTIAEVNIPENLNRLVKLTGATLEETTATAGKLIVGEDTIEVNNGKKNASQALHKIAEWAKGTKLENVTIVAILVAKSTTENQLLPISIEVAEETEAGEELHVERYPEMGYSPSPATVDFTAAKAFLGVNEVTDDMLWIVNPDNTEVAATSTDEWFNTQGYAKTWSELNEGAEAGICVKFCQAIPDGSYTILDMNGADVIGSTYTTKWALKANGKTYTYTINLEFVEVPDAGNLTKSDLDITTSVEYPIDEGSYVTKWATLSDEQVTAICTELGLQSLSEATVYGYNPTTGELLSNYAGFDGWRNADGDFQEWTGTADVPMCIKYSDGQNYECYNIAGMEPQTFKGYWAIANTKKYVLVEIDFTYITPPAIELTLVNVVVEGNVTYDVKENEYTEKSIILNNDQVEAILTGIGLSSFTDERCVAYIYNPVTEEFSNENYDGWRDANGLGQFWTGTAEAPICAKFQYSNEIICYNLSGIEPQTITTYYAIANTETKVAALIRVNFTYEGTAPSNIVAGTVKANANSETIYNLQGVRLEKLQKGLNIMGGKKMVVK